MGRSEGIRLNGDRLKKEIKNKGLRQYQFGMKCTEYMLDSKLWRAEAQHTEKQAGDWICNLCRPAEDPKKAGVHPALLSWMCTYFGVRSEYLTGADDYRTDNDVMLATLETADKRRAEMNHKYMRDYMQFIKSPVYALIKDRLLGGHVGVSFASADGLSFTFADDPGTLYEMDAQLLQKIEAACADLCCSLIRINAVSWTDKE